MAPHRERPAEQTCGHGLVGRTIEAKIRQQLFGTRATTRIGHFVIRENLAHGGMGSVYAAHDEQLGRDVAIKVLRDDARPSEADRLRFRREARALARVSHPNVVTMHEVGDVDGELYLTMELIRGQSVDAWLETKPGWRDVLELFVEVGRGLAAMHRAGLVHRDLKPQNIMRGDDGQVRIVDFGVVRVVGEDDGSIVEHGDESWGEASHEGLQTGLTQRGMLVGTPEYMSPEQLRAEICDAHSDQYSFCLSLFEALYGERPRVGCSRSELTESMRHLGEAASSEVPRWLGRVLLRGLESKPGARWPSIMALLEALQRPRRRGGQPWLTRPMSAGVLATRGSLYPPGRSWGRCGAARNGGHPQPRPHRHTRGPRARRNGLGLRSPRRALRSQRSARDPAR
ncbi:MAG: serine/threonine-protein kinase [Myxococcota bacterium]